MKKLLLSTICVVCFGLSANAKETAVLVEQKTPKIYDLIKIQIPNTYLKSGELNVTDEQRAKIMKLVKPLMHDVYQAKMNEAYGLEKRVQRDILQGKAATTTVNITVVSPNPNQIIAKTIHAIGGIPTRIVTIGLLIIDAVTKYPARSPKKVPIIKEIPKPNTPRLIVRSKSAIKLSSWNSSYIDPKTSKGLGSIKLP
jgi:hypothetical protein